MASIEKPFEEPKVRARIAHGRGPDKTRENYSPDIIKSSRPATLPKAPVDDPGTLPETLPGEPASALTIRLDASAGIDLPAQAHLEAVLRGADALAARARLSNLGQALDQPLTKYWQKEFDFIEPRSVLISFDAQTGEERVVVEGVAALDWKTADDGLGRRYEAAGDQMGLKAGSDQASGGSGEASNVVPAAGFEEIGETIVLPNHGQGFAVEGPDADQLIAGRAFHRTATIVDGVFSMTASLHGVEAVAFPAENHPTAQAANPDNAPIATLYVRAPPDYEATQKVGEALVFSPAAIRPEGSVAVGSRVTEPVPPLHLSAPSQ